MDKIREAEQKNVERHRAALNPWIFELADDQVKLLLSCAASANEAYSQDNDKQYQFVFLGLSSKIVSNARSAMSLAQQGHYGDALVLIRVMIGTVNTLQFLSLYDEYLQDWIDYSQAHDPSSLQAAERQRIRRIFKDSNVRAMLKSKNTHPMEIAYGDLSEAIHSSLWGLRFYAARRDGGSSFQFVPCYDPANIAGVLTSVMSLLTISIDMFLDRYADHVAEDSSWESLADQWEPLRPKCFAFVNGAIERVLAILGEASNGTN